MHVTLSLTLRGWKGKGYSVVCTHNIMMGYLQLEFSCCFMNKCNMIYMVRPEATVKVKISPVEVHLLFYMWIAN
jgi:hypothetical protein